MGLGGSLGRKNLEVISDFRLGIAVGFWFVVFLVVFFFYCYI